MAPSRRSRTNAPESPARRERALDTARREARDCQRCPLWRIGTQTVFGAGPADAAVVLIGEAPGYQEDQRGLPFVGPAGQLLNQALDRAGLPRSSVYVTNIVKHRPWVPDGPHGKNRPPRRGEIEACHLWLERELSIIRPAIVGCLGAIAAREVLGQRFRLSEQRGQWFATEVAPHVLATVHPAYVLIQPPASRPRWEQLFFDDIARIAERARQMQAEEDR